ncbi:MAG: protein kinase [Deltaproteobacteria bacterium]|nr:protein kinase [Deltaproteobacteria bacterium]
MQGDPASEQRVCPKCGHMTAAHQCPQDGSVTIARRDVDLGAPTEVLGRWRATGLISRDGGLTLWSGHELATRRPVRIAIVGLASSVELDYLGRMEESAKALERLRHERIARVIATGFGEHGDLVVVSEVVAGPTLAASLGKGLGPERCARLAEQLFDGLEAAHSAGVLHHELTPNHLRIVRAPDGGEDLVIQDLGLAELARLAHGGVAPDPTSLEPHVARYRAPEQLRDRALTRHADLYAAGTIVYELLCGRPVFDERTAADYLVAHLVKIPDRPTIDGAPVEGPLVEVVMRCLEKKPWNRPESAGAARDRLRGATESVVTGAPRARVLTSSVTRVVRNTGEHRKKVPTGGRIVAVMPPPLPPDAASIARPPGAPALTTAPSAALPKPPAPVAVAPSVPTNVEEPRRAAAVTPAPLLATRARRPWWTWAMAVAALVIVAFVAVTSLGPDPIAPAPSRVAERVPAERADAPRRPRREAPPRAANRAAPATKVEAIAPPPPQPAEAAPTIVEADEPLELEPLDEAPTPPSPAAAHTVEPIPTPRATTPPARPPSEAKVEPPAPKPEAPPVDTSPPPAGARRAMVKSTPPGATVFVDGRSVGTAPMTVSWADGAEPAIRLVLAGYDPVGLRLTTANANRMLSFTLLKSAGSAPTPPPTTTTPPPTTTAPPTTLPAATTPPPATAPPPEDEAPPKPLLERDWRPR